MEKKTPENKLKTNQVYLNKFDDIKIRVPKGYREKIHEYAKIQGISVNQLVIRALQADAKSNNFDLYVPSGMKELKQEGGQEQE